MRHPIGLVAILLLASSSALAGSLPTSASLTCNPDEIDPRSYRLTTSGVASVVSYDRTDWWRTPDLGRVQEDLADLNFDATAAAERAVRLDPHNRLAHAILARQYLIDRNREAAAAEWQAVLDSGGAVGWTGTLYDVDARTYFLLAFDREGLRIYRFDRVVEALKRGTGGIPQFPGPRDQRFWAAAAGCVDPRVEPEAFVPWSSVKEIKAGNWVLWFELTRPIRVSSDRNGKTKQLDQIKVNLHGSGGDWEVYKPVGDDTLAVRSRGPWGFQDLVRRTLVSLVDPEHRIALPASKPGVGW
jgi:hypothetical protein